MNIYQIGKLTLSIQPLRWDCILLGSISVSEMNRGQESRKYISYMTGEEFTEEEFLKMTPEEVRKKALKREIQNADEDDKEDIYKEMLCYLQDNFDEAQMFKFLNKVNETLKIKRKIAEYKSNKFSDAPDEK